MKDLQSCQALSLVDKFTIYAYAVRLKLNMEKFPQARVCCQHHSYFSTIISSGTVHIKLHFNEFASVVMDMYNKDDLHYGLQLKNPNDIFCFLYMTKSNNSWHLDTMAKNYIILRRPENEKCPTWMLLFTLSPIQESRSFIMLVQIHFLFAYII